jgi:hypothetical protein
MFKSTSNSYEPTCVTLKGGDNGVRHALDIDDAAKFWPIYSEYDAELTKLNNMRVENIEDYARNYSQMTDEKADELDSEEDGLSKATF